MPISSGRSPVNLRSRTSQNQSQKSTGSSQTKSQSPINSNESQKVSKTKTKQTDKPFDELEKLNKKIELQKAEFESNLQGLRDEIISKYNVFENVARKYENEMQQIKNNQNNIIKALFFLHSTQTNLTASIEKNKITIDGLTGENESQNESLSHLIIDSLSMKIEEIDEKILTVEQALISITEFFESNMAKMCKKKWKKIRKMILFHHMIMNLSTCQLSKMQSNAYKKKSTKLTLQFIPTKHQ